MTGSWKGRGKQYIQFVRVLYCKLPTNCKQLPAFTLEAMPRIEPQPQRWEESVTTLPLWPLTLNIQKFEQKEPLPFPCAKEQHDIMVQM